MRLIDADTLISALKNRSYKSTDWNDKTNKFNLPVVEPKDAIMAVEEQPVIITGANELTLEECGSKWIPCTERLPEIRCFANGEPGAKMEVEP